MDKESTIRLVLQTTIQKNQGSLNLLKIKNNIGVFSAIFLFFMSLTIGQDFLESIRNGNSFYMSESILFKTVWILFIPILVILSRILKNRNLDSFGKITFFIIAPIFIHLIVLPFVFLFFSVLFYDGRYGIYKILTYTLANDLYILVLVYSVFIIGYRFLSQQTIPSNSSIKDTYLKSIIINNSINHTIVEVNNIYQITADTPYIAIQLESKKYLHTTTLKSISTQLDQNRFVRVHKSTIVNLDKVVSFKSRLNGDYDIVLKNGSELRLSRTYATNFKSKFKNTHQVTT